jgi:HprK-related kinase A
MPAGAAGENRPMQQTVGSLSPSALARTLRAGQLRVVTGPFTTCIGSPLPGMAQAISRLYTHHRLADPEGFVDFDVRVRRPVGWRRWVQPQVEFGWSGQWPFNPLPGDQGFPLLEWGMNWCVYGHAHQYLILHAAVLERQGRALVLPAPSGSGKSTLCAALSFAGWRLLSDELTLIDPLDGLIVPVPRPVSLKNQSIEVIQRFAPQAHFGSSVSETAKGTVAHFRPAEDAVARSHERARPGWVVLPRYVPDSPCRLMAQEKASTLMQLVENCFNYPIFGVEGFELLGAVVDQSGCFRFEYSDIHAAVALFDRLADGQAPVTAP